MVWVRGVGLVSAGLASRPLSIRLSPLLVWKHSSSVRLIPRTAVSSGTTHLKAWAPNQLQTTLVPAGVLYLVEQPPYCDLLRLSLRLEGSSGSPAN